MRYGKKMNRMEKRAFNIEKKRSALAGVGHFVFQNSSRTSDLALPKPAKDGQRMIGPGRLFEGDDYFLQLVKTGQVRLIREIKPIDTTEEVLKEEVKMTDDRLILDQPDVFNESGKVEHVVKTPKKPLNENKGKSAKEEPPVLINENPVNDGFIVLS